MLIAESDLASQHVEERNRRLVISQIVMENFKSYAGRQVIGPFHKSFTSIVGPNGSGKSNVIDAFMFVLGFRAKKMRQAKLSELIHSSKNHLDIESCAVEVHFQSIIDHEIGEGFDVAPNSGLVVSRTAYRNGRNVYHVNGQVQTATEVATLLKGQGIDLDHNRFLILQGEVESIAQMKPKATTEHEEGLLEYLEDIIGTSDYIPQIESASKTMEETSEAYTEKLIRVRAATKECDSLSGEKEKAENYLRQENVLTELKCQRLQALTFKATREDEAAKGRLVENKGKLNSEASRFQAEKDQINTLSKITEGKSAELKESELVVKALTKELQSLEQDDVRMQETRKHMKNKLKGMNKSQSDMQKQKSELTRDLENSSFELKGLSEQITTLQQSLAHEEGELDRLCKSMQGITGKYQKDLEAKQQALGPFLDKMRKEQQALELAISSRDLLQTKDEASRRDLAVVQERMEQLEEEIRVSAEDKERLEDEAARILRQMRTIEDGIEKVETNISSTTKEGDMMNATIIEAKESLSQVTSGSAILQALLKEKRSGRIPGIHGRLGDLGTIDTKYDTAISTACSYLNHIVVDNTEAGQKCIEHLRKHNLGRANFIILEKMRPAQSAHGLPNGSKRLFDLVRIKDAKVFSETFYFALGDTLVAETTQEASQWAYSGKRFRVVTLDGKLIETSGTMSGGGRLQKGGMKANLGVEGVSQEQIDQLEVCLAERRQLLRQLNARLRELEIERHTLLEQQSRNEALLIKAEALYRNLPVELADLQAQLPALRQNASVRPSKKEQEKLKDLNQAIKSSQERITSLKEEMAPIEAQIAAVQAQIMEAGGLKFKTQRVKVDSLKEQIEHLSGRAKKILAEKATLESRLGALESGHMEKNGAKHREDELKQLEAKIEERTLEAAKLAQKLESATNELESIKEDCADLDKRMNELENNHSKFKKLEYDLKVRIEQDEDLVQQASKAIPRYNVELNALALHHIDLNDSKPVLSVHEDDDLRDFCKRLDSFESQIRVLSDRLASITPNLRVLEEYREKETRRNTLNLELFELDTRRQSARVTFDDLRHRRHDEFMSGFRLISTRLKEMYQLITMGGNAELELVDSLDPFSEGILFSVMPPKKSWKNISNLSGGEKTLSSLALVFALHTYKPTPIYVMDEIDAALDFRNVSIVAHYIKERTRDAQFVVISLRNGMFELADRLVGIYKTDQRTRSVTIDPKNFAVPTATTSLHVTNLC